MKSLRYLGLGVFLILLVATPWFYGAHQLHVQAWMWLLLAVVGAIVTVDCVVSRDAGHPIPVVFWVLVGALLLGGVQLIPLPQGIHESISPASARLWELQVPGLGAEKHTLSLYPHETRYNLALLLGAVCSFWIANRWLVTPNSRRIFMATIAFNGCLLTLLGVAHYLTAEGQNVIYWTVKLTQGGRPFASYVNRNHAGGYLNLCLAAGIALAIWVRMSGPGVKTAADRRTSWFLVAACMSLVLMIGVALSLSRSAVLGTMAGVGALLFVLAGSRHRGLAPIPLVMVAITLIGLLSSERGEVLVDRFQRATDSESHGTSSRFNHWRDSMQAVPDFPVFGTGLGTYRYVYRLYQSDFQSGWFYHAENQFVEAVVEGGAVGFGLLAVALASLAFAYWRRMREGRDVESLALVSAGAFALFSQTAQSCFDFGLYLPANAALLAAICGMSVAPTQRDAHIGARRALPVLVSVVLCALMMLSTLGMFGRAEGYRQVVSARTIGAEPQTDQVRLDGALSRLVRASARYPQDAETARALARLQIIGYRLAALTELEAMGMSPQDAWPLTSGLVVHRRVYESLQEPSRLQALRSRSAVRDYLLPANQSLKRSLSACPLIPEVHLTLAQTLCLEPGWSEATDTWLLKTATALNPTDPDILFDAGLMDMQAGRVQAGLERWRQSLDSSPRYVAEASRLAMEMSSIDQIMDWMLPMSPRPLLGVALALDPISHRTERLRIADLASQRLDDVSSSKGLSSAAKAYCRSKVEELRGGVGGRIEHLRKAIELSPRSLEWRYELAELLLSRGYLDEARNHIVTCVRLAPHRAKFQRLRDRISEQIHTTPPK